MSRISRGYSYQDLLLVPQLSVLDSRESPDLSVELNGGLSLAVPIFSAPMDTVTEETMAMFMDEQGGMGIIHRYMDDLDQVQQVTHCKGFGAKLVGASTGSNGGAFARAAMLIDAGVDVLVVDVAHGHSKSVLQHIERVRNYNDSIIIMSGNIATPQAALDSLSAGANLLRVGIGAGSACTTRLVAGVGVPQWTAIDSIREVLDDVPVIVADGGIKASGDIVKALAAGADAVMIGGMLARYPISPMPGAFRGMASREAIVAHKGMGPVTAEGETFALDLIEDYRLHFTELVSTIKQGFAYLGAANIHELRANARWMEVSALGYLEGRPHFQEAR